ncbi:MAG: EAL domain-containing protein [Desulfobacterales bacterium]|nr:EAL domain-containing protein [Desulfobacterales bacterium]
MSLFKQIQILMATLLVALLIIVLRINFNSAREFTANQTYNNAKNVANVLALSLGSSLEDDAFIRTSINAMFDGGYYQSITLVRTGGSVVYQKAQRLAVEGVPELFFNYIDVDIPVAESQVMAGWSVFGTVQVQGNTGQAYLKLWATFKQLCLLFAALGGIALGASYLVLKHLLRALESIQHQAEAISNNEFVITADIPRTPELKKVVLAMNAMVAKVQTIFNRHLENLIQFQELRDKDAITGLPNRNFLVKQLTRFLEDTDEKVHGQLIFIGLTGMERINVAGGHPVIRQLYRNLADVLKRETEQLTEAVVARFPRQEFAVLLPGATQEEGQAVAAAITRGFSQVIGLEPQITDSVNVSGGVTTYRCGEKVSVVLSKADYALSVARSGLPGAVESFKDEQNDAVMGKSEWKAFIEKAFLENRFILAAQPVLSDKSELHREVYISLVDRQGVEYRAGFFMPMIMSLGLAGKLDQYVLEHTARHLSITPGRVFAVNLTTEFCKDRKALPWLRQFLGANKFVQMGLTLEIQENALIQYPDICIDLAGLFHGLGYKFGIDQFTMNDTALNLLKKLKPCYIKIERDYLEVFDDPGKTDMVLNALFTITDSLDIKLIATKIETEGQRCVLADRNITYFQGRGIAEIAPLGNSNE